MDPDASSTISTPIKPSALCLQIRENESPERIFHPAQLVVQKGVGVVLIGRCGPDASQVFRLSGVDVITGVSGTVREVVEQFKGGERSLRPQPGAQGGFSRGGYPPPESPTGPGRVTVDELRAEVQQLKERLEKLTRILEELRTEP